MQISLEYSFLSGLAPALTLLLVKCKILSAMNRNANIETYTMVIMEYIHEAQIFTTFCYWLQSTTGRVKIYGVFRDYYYKYNRLILRVIDFKWLSLWRRGKQIWAYLLLTLCSFVVAIIIIITVITGDSLFLCCNSVVLKSSFDVCFHWIWASFQFLQMNNSKFIRMHFTILWIQRFCKSNNFLNWCIQSFLWIQLVSSPHYK